MATTYKIVILGAPPSKKNSKVWTGKYLVSNSKYQKWEKHAILQAKTQWKGAPLDTWLRMTAAFYLPTARKSDLSNLYEAPQDMLEKAGILTNDNLIVSHDGSRRYIDRDNPRMEIHLTECDEWDSRPC
jgi:Holliday junction resolvase RusA-like endonuclease